MYFAGEGVDENKIEAYKWFFISAELGSDDGKENSRFAGKSMGLSDIMQAKKLGREWLEEFENGSSDL